MRELERDGSLIDVLFIKNYKYLFGFISFTTVFFVIYCTYFSLINDEATVTPVDYEVYNEPMELDSFLPNTKCHLPKLKPFDESILNYVAEPAPVLCPSKNNPLLFSKTFDSQLLLVDNPMKYAYSKCSYRYLTRQNTSDSVILSDETFPITEMFTKIPMEHEFIAVNCTNTTSSKIIDMFPFVPLKTKNLKLRPQLGLNIVILGLDAVSHMNFIRVMPKSFEYLSKTVKATGMNGYTKIADNTFPNIVGVLLGKSKMELENDTCMTSNGNYFDECPFIWKNFSSSGYLTSFVEDSAWMSIFNYGQKGFKYPPTDYYTRPFSYMADNTIGSQKLLNAHLCNGPRLAFEVVVDYMQQTAVTMQRNHQNYFQFIWATSLFHDFLNEGKLGDEALLTALKMFTRENYFNNTIFILMSDHGARWGGIRETYQGKVEERMPFLYFAVPNKISSNPVYENALRNLRGNKERLTTPFDLHETLKDFLNLTNLENDNISTRSKILEGNATNFRGISLFLPIPPDRDCNSADIDEHWCVCHSRKDIPIENNKVVYEAAAHVVNNINEILNETKDAKCANLILQKINSVQEMTVDNSAILGSTGDDNSKKNLSEMTLAVNFLTSPGNGSFEATVKRLVKNDTFSWSVLGDISRTNLYGNQSSCVQSYRFKKFCYCL